MKPGGCDTLAALRRPISDVPRVELLYMLLTGYSDSRCVRTTELIKSAARSFQECPAINWARVKLGGGIIPTVDIPVTRWLAIWNFGISCCRMSLIRLGIALVPYSVLSSYL